MSVARTDPVVEIYGTIQTAYPVSLDRFGNYIQTIIVSNATAQNLPWKGFIPNKVTIDVKVASLMDAIPFVEGYPVTGKGQLVETPGKLPRLAFTHSPIGLIRYNGKIYQ